MPKQPEPRKQWVQLNNEYIAFTVSERQSGQLWKNIPSLTDWVCNRLFQAEAAQSELIKIVKQLIQDNARHIVHCTMGSSYSNGEYACDTCRKWHSNVEKFEDIVSKCQ